MCHVARTEGTACCPQRIPWQATEIPRYGCPGTRHGMTQGGGSLLRLFRAPQIARAWHALHPKSLPAPYVQKQPAAAQYASTQHGMTQGGGSLLRRNEPAPSIGKTERRCIQCRSVILPTSLPTSDFTLPTSNAPHTFDLGTRYTCRLDKSCFAN